MAAMCFITYFSIYLRRNQVLPNGLRIQTYISSGYLSDYQYRNPYLYKSQLSFFTMANPSPLWRTSVTKALLQAFIPKKEESPPIRERLLERTICCGVYQAAIYFLVAASQSKGSNSTASVCQLRVIASNKYGRYCWVILSINSLSCRTISSPVL